MTYRLGSTVAAAILIIFAVYLLSYGSYVLWDYHRIVIPEATDRDAHGMSRLVGYTFILLLGIMSLGLGFLALLCKDIIDPRAQQKIASGLFTVSGLSFSLSLFCQIQYWASNWGQLYLGTFALVTIIFGYVRFIRRS